MRLQEAIWPHLASSGLIWGHLASSGLIWRHLASSGVIWPHLALSGASGLIWLHLASSGLIWRPLIWGGSNFQKNPVVKNKPILLCKYCPKMAFWGLGWPGALLGGSGATRQRRPQVSQRSPRMDQLSGLEFLRGIPGGAPGGQKVL